jgi:membrane protein implicated in regulation of membrane protease activity
METIASILTVIFVGLLVAGALTFGFALLIWFGLFAAIVTALVMLKHLWYRWRFMQTSGRQETDVQIIEVDYEDISSQKDDDSIR